MLANPVVIPIYANPLTWVVAAIAILIEVRVWLIVLRRLGSNVSGLETPLAVVQLVTWVPFLFAVDAIPPTTEHVGWQIAALEVSVVLVEVPLVLAAARGWFVRPRLPSADMTWIQALVASFAGNLASVTFSLGIPLFAATLSR